MGDAEESETAPVEEGGNTEPPPETTEEDQNVVVVGDEEEEEDEGEGGEGGGEEGGDEEPQLQFEDAEDEEQQPEVQFDEGSLKKAAAAAKDKKGKGDKKKKKQEKKDKVKKEKPPPAKKKRDSSAKKKEKKPKKPDRMSVISGRRTTAVSTASVSEGRKSKRVSRQSTARRSSVRQSTVGRSSAVISSSDSLESYSSGSSYEVDARASKARHSRVRRRSGVSTTESVDVAAKATKAKQKKAGKGKKKGKSQVVLEVTSEEKEAEAEPASTIETSDVPEEPPAKKKKKKKAKKKKKEKELTPKEKKKLEEDRRKAEEEEAARAAEELRLRLIAERRMAIEKERRDIVEQELRLEQFRENVELLEGVEKAGRDAYMADKIREEWDNYLVCDGRPDPADVPQMNTYLHLWENEIETMTTELAVYRTNEMYNLLDKLQELIDDPFDVTESKQADWIWIRSRFRDLQLDNLNFCTYRLIRNIEYRLNRIDIPTADFRLNEENFALCLWVPVQLPIPIPNPRNPSRPRVHMDWPEMSMNVLFPQSLDCEGLVLRAMYVKYNHLSDTSHSYADPPIPEFLNKDLSEITANEWRAKLMYKYENRVKTEPETILDENGEVVPPEPEPAIGPDELPPIVPYLRLEPTASDYVQAGEDVFIEEAKNSMRMDLPDKVINLRKYVVLGGVYYLDLFVQPTQPQEMVSYEIFITNLILPCEIEKAPFYVEYLPPPPPAPGVRRSPEEIEEELMKQEREFEKLTLVTLDLPKEIVWMDVPLVCHWCAESKEWSTADVHDFKHIEEKGYVSFRTGRFGPFAVATYKYPNFPFQAWELRPEPDGSVTLQITAAILLIEFHVKDHTVCLSQFQNAPNKVMDGHLNVYYKLPKLIRIMRDCGVDVFPAFDTFFYVEGTCEKYWPMEEKTYFGMALTAIAYNFSWSRWNMTSDYKTIVMQARVYRFDKPKQLNFSTCLITPLRATMIECTEVSPAFSDEPIEGMRFYADFYHLIKGQSTMAAKDRISEANPAMVNSLAKLLLATRFLSFS